MDVIGRVLTISAERMKAKREHRVPLCGRAVEILEAARALVGDSNLVFPMRGGRSIAGSTLPKMLKYHGIAAVAHGFQSSFRDWAAEKTDLASKTDRRPAEIAGTRAGPQSCPG